MLARTAIRAAIALQKYFAELYNDFYRIDKTRQLGEWMKVGFRRIGRHEPGNREVLLMQLTLVETIYKSFRAALKASGQREKQRELRARLFRYAEQGHVEWIEPNLLNPALYPSYTAAAEPG